jgi:transcriptional regulator with XRE-family HTH domain
MDDSLTLGGRVLGRRRSLKLSQWDLANKAGVTQGALSMIENDHRNPSFGVIVRLADALDVSLDFLAGRDNR